MAQKTSERLFFEQKNVACLSLLTQILRKSPILCFLCNCLFLHSPAVNLTDKRPELRRQQINRVCGSIVALGDHRGAEPVQDFLQQIEVYRDDHLLVVHKPAGLLSVPGKSAELADCLRTRLEQALPGVRLVHRLDRDTSGLMVFARDLQTQRDLSRQFELRQVHKQYQALASGLLQGSGRIVVPVRYEPMTPPLHVADPEYPKPAVTDWQAQQTIDLPEGVATAVLLSPVTGRSHQLRVHLQWLGHALVGDTLYAESPYREAMNRLALHAARLALQHPHSGQWLAWSCDAPFWRAGSVAEAP